MLKYKATTLAITSHLLVNSFAYAENQVIIDLKDIERVTVTGKRSPLFDIRDVNAAALGIKDPLTLPISIQSFSEQLISDQRLRTLSEVLANDASVQNTAIGSVFDFVSLRGYQLDWTNGLRRDGLALAPYQDVALENIARVDVLKGPSGLISGFNNPGGTINYVTKRPTLEKFVDVSAELRSRDGKYLHIDLGGQFTNNATLGYRFNAALEDTGDFTGGDDLERQFLSAAIDWQANDDLIVRLDIDYQDKSIVSQPLIGLAQDPDNINKQVLPPYIDTSEVLLGQPWAQYQTETLNIGTRVDYWLNSNWQWVNQVSLSSNDRFTIFPDIYAVNLDGDVLSSGIHVTPDESYKTLSGHSLLNGDFTLLNMQHELVVGGSFRDYQSDDGRWFELNNPIGNIFTPTYTDKPDFPPLGDTTHTETVESSLFITDIIHLTESIFSTLGLRYLHYQKDIYAPNSPVISENHKYYTPTLGLNYNFTNNGTWYASFSKGVGEGGVAVIGSGAHNEGDSLGPQKSEQIETGIKYRLANATFTAALFEIEKMLEYHNKQSNYFVQDGIQRHRGLELNINGELSENISLVTSATLLDAELVNLTGETDINGNRPPNVPKKQANIYLDYAVPFVEKLNVNAGIYYVGEREQNVQNTLSLPSYTRLDAGIKYELSQYKTTLRFKVENITDKEYWLSAGAKGVDWGVTPGRGRTLIGSISLSF
ncbi:TonB-dependent siderophore receptor [Colwellia sp. D2M02]|uniref:TonB-dependent siderophore receptor n=1 Tax=Colwellia sp. D2M02 TaxID=2841562 RepID=UPI001C086B52|nr:TonB-dependent siderophore receptor [Colwellia sp. D2M02]MBU2893377.1 TonB-dependent siderophore receptor [Colwellia sp. D2M02]